MMSGESQGSTGTPGWMDLLRGPAASRGRAWVLLEGREAVEAAQAGWWEVAGVMVAESHPWEVPTWSGLEVRRAGDAEMGRIGCPQRHGGVLGLARVPAETREVATFAQSLASDALLVVCPRLSDPVFAGGLMAQAAKLGAAGVLFGAEGVSPFDPAAVAASAGAVFRLAVRVADAGQMLRSLKAASVDLSGWEEGAGPLVEHPMPRGRRALVVGEPGFGLGPFWRAHCDRWGGGDLETIFRGLTAAAT